MVGESMTVLIVIHYISNDNKIMRRGSYPLKGKQKEVVALEFWKWIKREHPYPCVIEKVIVDGEDLTDKVKELEIAE
jgi:hypothetical protein